MSSSDAPVDPGRRLRVDIASRLPIGPLAWLLLTPLVTIPATAAVTGVFTQVFSRSFTNLDAMRAAAAANPYCPVQVSLGPMAILGEVDAAAVCPDRYVLAALLPGVLNLVPLLWLFTRSLQMRRAAIIASALGGLRFLLPALGVLAIAPPSEYGGVLHGFTVLTPGGPWPYPNSWNAIPLVSAGLWAATLVAYVVHRRTLHRESAPPSPSG